MKQFYVTYRDDEFVTTLLTQISWSNHLAIMAKAKTAEERHFYISLCVKECSGKRIRIRRGKQYTQKISGT